MIMTNRSMTESCLPPDLTGAQCAIWLDQQLFLGKPIYNTGQVITIRGKLRVDLFEIALRDTVAESPFIQLPPRSGPVSFGLKLLDFRKKKDPLAAAENWMRTEMGEVIPLEDLALFRFALIRVSEDRTLWFQKFHHIITDATGRRLLSARTAARYRALRFGEALAALDATTPEELLDAERRYAASNSHEIDRNYWLAQSAHWPEPLLQIDRRNTERLKSGRHARIKCRIKRADFTRLETTARALGSSASRAIIALTYVAFARLYDRYDIVLGVELANRRDARAKQAVGLLARPLPMFLTFDHTTTIADAVHRIDETRAQTYPHRHFPIQELVRDLGISREGRYSLFDVIINYIPDAYDFAFEDFPVETTIVSHGFTAPWTVTIVDTNLTRDLDVSIDTDPGLISAEMAAQLASCLQTLLRRGMDDPACPLGSLPIMPEAIREQLLDFAAGETVVLPEGATLATLCAAQADRTPDALALICGEQQLSFAILHERAARLAWRLTSLGVRPGVVVGIALPRTPDLVVAVLAVHKAGGSYLALDPSYPVERIRFIIADAAAPVIVTSAALAPGFSDSGARLLFNTEQDDEEIRMVQPLPAGPEDLAYVLYTSGSTGRPKAVGIEHRNLINLISWGRSIVSEAELRGMLFSTSLNFDLSAFEMFLPLAFGGCIFLVEDLLALQSAPQREKISLINTGPSLFEALLRADALPSGVTTVILAGEKLSRRLAASIFNAAPRLRLLNCYGPTETTVYSSWAVVDPEVHSEPTIGRAIWNTTLHVLDRGGALLPPGIEGDLFIGGSGVARGYLDRPELTAERFQPSPHGLGKLYRTGDRVRWRANGELDFLGRADDQMKINGIRVEPGEIEATLLALPGITAGVVTLYEDAAGTHRLTAYLVASGGAAPNTEAVRAALERQLPRNMVPTFFVWLDAMPMTPNGKLDRKALPIPSREETPAPLNRLPDSTLEREITGIWEDLLRVSPIGVESDFFDLGGDSLALVSLFATIEARFARRLTADLLPGGLSVARLAQVLAADEPFAAGRHPLVSLQPLGDLPPFFCVHGIGGDVLHLHRLALQMGTDRPFFGIRRTPDAPLMDTIGQMAAHYIATMLLRQPSGPFYLGGHSFGAMVAYEMALQLVKQGHEIGLLAVIDQRKPGWRLTPREVLPALPRILFNIPARIRDELAQAPATDRIRHMRRTMLRWSKSAIGIRPDVNSMFDLGRREKEQTLLFEAHLRALSEYRPVPTQVPITLFRASQQLLSHLVMDRTLGWSELAESPVSVRIIPGSHGTILTEPSVRQLAKILSDELDAAQGVPRGRPRPCGHLPKP
jgi:amino acid adenylation domain-containing protein